ncbi:MAG: hypothetical protein J6S63_03530, partial [Atopobiaceae bacterium]|nr:hypothetical protein [Atopobiaceae bacterium]
MFIGLRKGWAIAAALVLAIVGLGATPALAEGEHTYAPGDAKLTKVIVAPAGTDASEDEYVFHFAGAGTVTESGDDLVSDGVMQDGSTLKKDDEVPNIPEVKLNGVELNEANYLSNGQVVQAVAQKSISEILQGVTFPHAGIYTYEVTEQSANTTLTDGTYINPSQAKYKLRIRVGNTNTGNSSALGNRELAVEDVTVDQMKNDNGGDKTGKVDPTYPVADTN